MYFCLPKAAISACGGCAAAELAKVLVKRVVAVKVSRGAGAAMLKNEVRVLLGIAAARGAESGAGAFCSVLEYGEVGGDGGFLVLGTLPVCSALEGLVPSMGRLPETLVWLVYRRVGEALAWLDEVCRPAVVHGDVHAGNVVVGYADVQDQVGEEGRLALPEIKLIDFGKACSSDQGAGYEYTMFYEQMKREDKGAFLRVLAAMLGVTSFDRRSPCGHSGDGDGKGKTTELREFRTCIQRAVKRSSWDNDESLAELSRRFGAVAERQIAEVEDADLEQIKDAIIEIMKDRRQIIDKKIGEVVGIIVD